MAAERTGKTWKRLVTGIAKQALALALIAWLAHYLIRNWDRFRDALDASPCLLLGIVMGVVLTWLVSSVQVYVLLRAEGTRIGFWEHFLLMVSTVLLNFLPMRVGTLVRLHYVRKMHGVSYARSGSLMGIRLVIVFCTTAVLGLIGTVGLWLGGQPLSVELLLLFAAMLGCSIVAFACPLPVLKNRKGPLARVWADFAIGFRDARSQPRLMLQVATFVLLHFLVLAGRLHLAFQAVQAHVSPFVLLIAAPMTTITMLLAFTMGSLGLREGIIGYITLATGYDLSSGVFAGTIDRAGQMVVTFLLGSVATVYVWWRLRRTAASGSIVP